MVPDSAVLCGMSDFLPLLEKNLTMKPYLCGAPPFADRAAWKAAGANPGMAAALQRARARLNDPFPVPPDELYCEYYATGNRTRYQDVYHAMEMAATDFCAAFAVTGERCFLDKLEEVLKTFLAMKSWMLPAHDRDRLTFDGKEEHIELASSLLSWRLGLVCGILGDVLDPAVASELKGQIFRRTLEPARAMVAGERPAEGWMCSENNWNAVCWSGVLGAALAVADDRSFRLRMADAALRRIGFSLRGFGGDGYCFEGLGYWNYGYGHNLLFAALVLQSTGGALNLMDDPAMRAPAFFPERLTLGSGAYPAFADCRVGAKPDPGALALRDWLLGRPFQAEGGTLFNELLLLTFLPRSSGGAAGAAELEPVAVFESAGVAVLRSDAETRLAAAFKAGSNHELHNHNDVGSYVVTLDGVAMLFDPGCETYSARTFGARRYESKLLNSWGHPVPVVGGCLQRSGEGTDCRILARTSTPERFEWTIDLAPAYGHENVIRLERIFRFERGNGGKVTVTDRGEFSTPVLFESVIVTPGDFTGSEIVCGTRKLKAVVKSSFFFEFMPEEICEDAPYTGKILRVGARGRESVTACEISWIFTPEED